MNCRPTPRAHLAGYKLPRELIVVDQVERMPNGKADLRWAKGLLRSTTQHR